MGLGALLRLGVLLPRFTRSKVPSLPVDLESLPTVSVCIPARNETHAMTQCLERVIASAYPKLEIIVLDDSSVDNTSILIKSFAHAGVRFVEGAPLPEGWLGKNHALHELLRESSGEYVLFMDVDTHLSPISIDAMMAVALKEKAPMVSVLPRRDDAWRASVLFATLRHFWSVLLHTKASPASASSAWLVQRKMIHDSFHDLSDLASVVAPEKNIARYAAQHHRYRFLLSTSDVGMTYEKKWQSQCETSVRLLYPSLGGRISRALIGLLLIAVALVPFMIVPHGLISEWQLMHSVALAAAASLLLTYLLFIGNVWRRGWIVGGLIFPVVLAQEFALLVASIYAYTTGRVTWKGRPIHHSARQAAEGKSRDPHGS